MDTNLASQTISFIVYFFAGLSAGFLYDIIRAVRLVFSVSRKKFYLYDLIYLIFTFIFLLYSLYSFTDVSLRWYLFIGLGFGFVIYFLLLSKGLLRIIKAVYITVFKLIYNILRIITRPIYITIVYIGKKSRIIKRFFAVINKKNQNIYKKTLVKFKRIGIILSKT